MLAIAGVDVDVNCLGAERNGERTADGEGAHVGANTPDEPRAGRVAALHGSDNAKKHL